jgi:AraC-like DNA-binding protein
MLLEHPEVARPDDRSSLALIVGSTTPPLVDAAYRLLSLLDAPEDAGALAPLAERELLWRLLRSPAGMLLRHMTASGSPGEQVHRAVRWLRNHFADPVSIEQLATIAGMSTSALHQHFKTITGLSPLRYRTRLRVQEARRLMIADGLDAASAGFQVGYGSPSQFSRDYTRALGVSPGRDIARLRAAGSSLAAAE